METKMMAAGDIFTDKQLKLIIKLKKADLILKEVIEPNFDEIQKKCGQEMDKRYLAYMGEYLAMRFNNGG
jgi:hypothetical protein